MESKLARPRYSDVRSAADHFGISRSRLYLLKAAGDILMKKVGSRTLVDLDSVENYIARQPSA